MNINNVNSNCKRWHLITIEDPEALPGKNIFNIIQQLMSIVEFRFAILNDINGARISSLIEKENTVLKIGDVLSMLCEVVQFDWGDFFLFKNYPENWNHPEGINNYPKLITQTDTTVRAIDDTYIYIYTPYQEIVNMVKEKYIIESLKTDILENLDYPY
jgi:hypothetical protein